MREATPGFVCPACKSPVEKKRSAYACGTCNRIYPILFGIPDFRLQGDRYLSLEEEREKATRLHDFSQMHDLRALISFYYSITDDVPPDLERLFKDYLLNAPERSAPAVAALAPSGGRSLIDLGCGSGGALVAAEKLFDERTGVDLALRWLVIARKRLDEAGVSASLVCADVEAAPFAAKTFSHALARDLLEHTRSPAAAIGSAASMLQQHGRLYISSSNAAWIGPHPASRVWAAGLIPTKVRASILRRRHDVDILRAVDLVSPRSVRRIARAAGFRQLDAGPLQPEMGQLGSRSALFRFFASIYSMLAKVPVLRTALLYTGPVFQANFVKESSE